MAAVKTETRGRSDVGSSWVNRKEAKTKKRKKRGREGGREDATWRCDAMRRGGVIIHEKRGANLSTTQRNQRRRSPSRFPLAPPPIQTQKKAAIFVPAENTTHGCNATAQKTAFAPPPSAIRDTDARVCVHHESTTPSARTPKTVDEGDAESCREAFRRLSVVQKTSFVRSFVRIWILSSGATPSVALAASVHALPTRGNDVVAIVGDSRYGTVRYPDVHVGCA